MNVDRSHVVQALRAGGRTDQARRAEEVLDVQVDTLHLVIPRTRFRTVHAVDAPLSPLRRLRSSSGSAGTMPETPLLDRRKVSTRRSLGPGSREHPAGLQRSVDQVHPADPVRGRTGDIDGAEREGRPQADTASGGQPIARRFGPPLDHAIGHHQASDGTHEPPVGLGSRDRLKAAHVQQRPQAPATLNAPCAHRRPALTGSLRLPGASPSRFPRDRRGMHTQRPGGKQRLPQSWRAQGPERP
jgi:hypothetical protein